jgi:hypothetical protein
MKLTNYKYIIAIAKHELSNIPKVCSDFDDWQTISHGDQPIFDMNIYCENNQKNVTLYKLVKGPDDYYYPITNKYLILNKKGHYICKG